MSSIIVLQSLSKSIFSLCLLTALLLIPKWLLICFPLHPCIINLKISSPLGESLIMVQSMLIPPLTIYNNSMLLCAFRRFLAFAKCKYTISRARDNSSAIFFGFHTFYLKFSTLFRQIDRASKFCPRLILYMLCLSANLAGVKVIYLQIWPAWLI